MKLLLHIGAPKTGTSAIQEMLRRHVGAWKAECVIVCPEPHDHAFRYLQNEAFPPNLRRRFATREAALAWSEDRWRALEALVAEGDAEAVVMSSEYFIVSHAKQALAYRLGAMASEIHVLAYVRDPVETFVSLVDQAIRDGLRLENLRVLEDRRKGWLVPALDRFGALFGAERLVVRNVARANLVQGDVVADFLAVVSDTIGRRLPFDGIETSKNRSLCGAATAWLLQQNESAPVNLRHNGTPEMVAQRRDLVDALRETPELAGWPHLHLDDPVLRGFVARKFAEETAALNARYLTAQQPIAAERGSDRQVSTVDLQRHLRDWIMGYLTPEAARAVAEIAARPRRPAGQGTALT